MEHEIDKLMTTSRLEADLARILTLAESGISVLVPIDPTDKQFFLERGWEVRGIRDSYLGLGKPALAMVLRPGKSKVPLATKKPGRPFLAFGRGRND